MQFVDKAFARRLESCEEMPQVCMRGFSENAAGGGAAEEEICGGHMVFADWVLRSDRATGAGLDQPAHKRRCRSHRGVLQNRKAPSQVDLRPLHGPEVFEMFKERGYAIAELNNVLYRKLDPEEKFPAPPEDCDDSTHLTRRRPTLPDRSSKPRSFRTAPRSRFAD